MPSTTVAEYYGSDAGRRFLLHQTVLLAVNAAALCAVFGNGRVDIAVAGWFFDDVRHVFPLTDQWLLKDVLHDAVRMVGAVSALALLGLTVTSWITPRPQRLHEHRRTLLLVCGACYSGAAAVEILKHFSAHACPWDLALFGGTAAYQPLFGAPIAAQIVRGCSPAAHPLVGYAWLGVGFAVLPVARSAAWRAWAGALALGTVCGAVQILRGAHFLSHVLWCAWIVWGVNILLLTVCICLPASLRLGDCVWPTTSNRR
jgi:membrane-associated PAP2 superfamily phosphatase